MRSIVRTSLAIGSHCCLCRVHTGTFQVTVGTSVFTVCFTTDGKVACDCRSFKKGLLCKHMFASCRLVLDERISASGTGDISSKIAKLASDFVAIAKTSCWHLTRGWRQPIAVQGPVLLHHPTTMPLPPMLPPTSTTAAAHTRPPRRFMGSTAVDSTV